jgi:tetratricopeptide (TPR) repeat protein
MADEKIKTPPVAPVEPSAPPGSARLEASGKGSVVVWNAIGTTINTGALALGGRTRLALVLVVAVLVLSAAITIVRTLIPQVTPPPGGAVNVGVAELITQDASGRGVDIARSAELTQQVYELLAKRAESASETSSVAVWPPSWTGRIDSPARASKRAQDINADVLVYGTLSVGPDTTRVRPRFYLTSTLLPGAEELAGEHEFGAEIVSPGDMRRNPGTFEDVKQKLVNRASALQQVIYGLGEYQRDSFDAAAASFDLATRNVNWQGREGKEILYLFGGFNAGKRNDLDGAASFFARAQEFESTKARAQLGAAEVTVQRFGAQQNCASPGTDLDQLHGAAAAFEGLLAGPAGPASASLRPKARFGIGQVYFCISQAQLENRWDAAADAFKQVIATYEAGDETIKYLAAESHANLGFIGLPWAGEASGPERDAKYRNAAEEYRKASALSEAHPLRKAFFSSRVGILEARLGRFDKAEEAFAVATALDPANADVYQQQLQQARAPG